MSNTGFQNVPLTNSSYCDSGDGEFKDAAMYTESRFCPLTQPGYCMSAHTNSGAIDKVSLQPNIKEIGSHTIES